MALRDIVNVQIIRETERIDRESFDIPLFVVESTAFGPVPGSPTYAERVRSYSSIDEVADDFLATDAAYKMASAAFSQEIRLRTIKIGVKNTAESWSAALSAIVTYDNEWYGLAINNPSKAAITEVAAWVESRTKLFIAKSSDADVLTNATNDVASTLAAAEYERTALLWHSQAVTQYPDAAWLGNCFVNDPGSETWKFKELTSIPFDTLTATQRSNALAKKANVYLRIAGKNMTEEGTVASGEYIDIIRGIDWLTSDITVAEFDKLINARKISFTNKGIAIIETTLRQRLDFAVERGLLAIEPPYTVTVPDVLATDELDRKDRHLKGIKFKARLQGAIHKVDIVGTVTI